MKYEIKISFSNISYDFYFQSKKVGKHDSDSESHGPRYQLRLVTIILVLSKWTSCSLVRTLLKNAGNFKKDVI